MSNRPNDGAKPAELSRSPGLQSQVPVLDLRGKRDRLARPKVAQASMDDQASMSGLYETVAQQFLYFRLEPHQHGSFRRGGADVPLPRARARVCGDSPPWSKGRFRSRRSLRCFPGSPAKRADDDVGDPFAGPRAFVGMGRTGHYANQLAAAAEPLDLG